MAARIHEKLVWKTVDTDIVNPMYSVIPTCNSPNSVNL
jgi:hypothetical protein